MALIDFVRIRIDDSMAAEVGQVVTDQLGYDPALGQTRLEFLHSFVKNYLILTYQRGEKRTHDDSFVKPADPDLSE